MKINYNTNDNIFFCHKGNIKDKLREMAGKPVKLSEPADNTNVLKSERKCEGKIICKPLFNFKLSPAEEGKKKNNFSQKILYTQACENCN